MTQRARAISTLLVLAATVACTRATPATKPADLSRLTLPAGFRMEVYASGVEQARELAIGAKGTVFAGSFDAGNVYALVDADHDGRAERVLTIASGFDKPSGIAFHDGDLYIAAMSRIYKLNEIEAHLDAPPKPELVTDKLPKDEPHGWKFIAFGPDGRLYVPIGAPCNVCDKGNKYAKIVSMKPDGSDWKDVALGIRNSVGFDWQPGTNELWFTDNGRDMLGDELPGDELDRVTRAGEHFGYPFCHQGDSPDPEFGRQRPCGEFTSPAANLGAHVAALGMRFYGGSRFPAAYRGNIFIAEHGSWNRSKKSGYQVVRVPVDAQGRAGTPEAFVQGWLKVDASGRETVSGRPADVLPLPDGSLLISDDLAGAIYRVHFVQ